MFIIPKYPVILCNCTYFAYHEVSHYRITVSLTWNIVWYQNLLSYLLDNPMMYEIIIVIIGLTVDIKGRNNMIYFITNKTVACLLYKWFIALGTQHLLVLKHITIHLLHNTSAPASVYCLCRHSALYIRVCVVVMKHIPGFSCLCFPRGLQSISILQ